MDPLDVVLVIAKMVIFGQEVLNVFHCSSTGDHPVDEAVIDITQKLDTIYATIDQSMANDLAFSSIVLKNLTQDFDMGEWEWPNLATGASATDPLPAGVAGLITLPTARLKTRGRKFLPGLTEGDTDNGVFNVTFFNEMVTFASHLTNTFIGVESGDPYAFGVVDSSQVFWPFVSAIVSNIPAYQRRRKQGVGS